MSFTRPRGDKIIRGAPGGAMMGQMGVQITSSKLSCLTLLLIDTSNSQVRLLIHEKKGICFRTPQISKGLLSFLANRYCIGNWFINTKCKETASPSYLVSKSFVIKAIKRDACINM